MITPARIENDIRDLFDRVEELEARLSPPESKAGEGLLPTTRSTLDELAQLRKENEDLQAELDRANKYNGELFQDLDEAGEDIVELDARLVDTEEDLARERNAKEWQAHMRGTYEQLAVSRGRKLDKLRNYLGLWPVGSTLRTVALEIIDG